MQENDLVQVYGAPAYIDTVDVDGDPSHVRCRRPGTLRTFIVPLSALGHSDQNVDCPNGPLRDGSYPCLRGPRDECLTCGWAPPQERSWFVERVVLLFHDLARGTGVKAW